WLGLHLYVIRTCSWPSRFVHQKRRPVSSMPPACCPDVEVCVARLLKAQQRLIYRDASLLDYRLPALAFCLHKCIGFFWRVTHRDGALVFERILNRFGLQRRAYSLVDFIQDGGGSAAGGSECKPRACLEALDAAGL